MAISEQSLKLNFETPSISFKKVKGEVMKATNERMSMLEHHMRNINVALGEELFFFKNGFAQLINKNEVEITHLGNKEKIWAEHTILATGSRPRKLPNIPIDEKHILTSDGIDKLEEFPESIVILGAGVIGCEFATIFSNFGRTKVHLIDKGSRILPFEDTDVVEIIEHNLEQKGVLIHRNSRLIDMTIENERVVYTLEYTDGSKEIFAVQKALVSVGRVPNYENLFSNGLEIDTNKRGIIDTETQTSVSNIYAVGDVTADIALVNVGELEGRHAVERIYNHPEKPLVYDNISTIMFLSPEVAGVGLNETQAQEKRLNYRVVSLNYTCISRAIAMRNTQGFIKILVSDDNEMKIMGMRVVGEHASSAIEAVALLISINGGIDELAELIHPHPSIIEGIQECVRILLGKSMLKPYVMRTDMVYRRFADGKYANMI